MTNFGEGVYPLLHFLDKNITWRLRLGLQLPKE